MSYIYIYIYIKLLAVDHLDIPKEK